MDQTLHALGGIVLNGLPTFFLIIILAVCVKYLYLKPLDKVLAERFRLTEGARKAAEESLKNADTKVAEYETALAEARSEIYQEQSEFLKKVHEEQAAQVRAAAGRVGCPRICRQSRHCCRKRRRRGRVLKCRVICWPARSPMPFFQAGRMTDS